MDLRAYYQKLHKIQAGIADEFSVVISNATPDGGRADVRTEVTRSVAARLLVEGKARLATAEESEQYRGELLEARQQADQAAAASRVQVTVISDAELRSLRDRARPPKG